MAKLPSEKMLAKHFAFLDQLSESGVTNMFGASPYLQESFGMSRDEATPVLSAWMKTFSEAEPSHRAKIAKATA